MNWGSRSITLATARTRVDLRLTPIWQARPNWNRLRFKSKMAAVGTMYRVRPHYNVREGVSLPDVMYKMRPLTSSPLQNNQNCSLKSLELRQISLLEKLDVLIGEAASMESGGIATSQSSDALNEILKPDCPTDVVVRMNPLQPMRWLLHAKEELEKKKIQTWWKYHTHSSVTNGDNTCGVFPAFVEHEDRHQYQLIVTVLTTSASHCPSLHISPSSRTAICGETNILRFFARVLGVYDTGKPADDVTMDLCLDTCDVIMSPSKSSQEKAAALKCVSTNLEKKSWFSGPAQNLTKSFLKSVLTNYGVKNIPQEALKRWIGSNH